MHAPSLERAFVTLQLLIRMTLNCSFVKADFVAKYFRLVALLHSAWLAKTLRSF